MKILFLDDQKHRHKSFLKRKRGEDVKQAFTVIEAIKLLEDYSPFDGVYLDHDIGGFFLPSDEKSGYEVAKFISEMQEDTRPGFVMVHSHNERGAFKIMKLLREVGIDCQYEPFQ